MYISGYGCVFDTINMLCPSLSCKNTQDSCPTTHIKNNFILKKLRVLCDGVHVSICSDLFNNNSLIKNKSFVYLVLQHVFVNGKMGIGVKVIIFVLNIEVCFVRFVLETGF